MRADPQIVGMRVIDAKNLGAHRQVGNLSMLIHWHSRQRDENELVASTTSPLGYETLIRMPHSKEKRK